MNVDKIIRLARKHRDKGIMASSARSCLADAIGQYDKGEFKSAKMWALKSLAYSVGMAHEDYIKASK